MIRYAIPLLLALAVPALAQSPPYQEVIGVELDPHISALTIGAVRDLKAALDRQTGGMVRMGGIDFAASQRTLANAILDLDERLRRVENSAAKPGEKNR